MTDKKLYWLRDARLKDRYIVAGKPWDLVPSLSFLAGMREKAEQISFALQRLWPGKRLCRAQDILKAWETLNNTIDIEHAFLLDTRWYKQTVFIGPVTQSTGEKNFVKFFKNRDDAALALYQSEFMDTYFSSHFKTVSAKLCADIMAIYPLIEHNTTVIPFHELALVTKEVAAHLYAMNVNNTKPISSFITLDMPIMFKKHGAEGVWRQVREFIEGYGDAGVAITPIHGDMVPWNVFYDTQGLMTLVDYERCGWHVPFYDFFHLIVQPGCMKEKVIDVATIWSDIDQDKYGVATWFTLYLLDQLRFDMDSYYNQGQQYPRLKKAIDIKLTLLETAIKEISNDA